MTSVASKCYLPYTRYPMVTCQKHVFYDYNTSTVTRALVRIIFVKFKFCFTKSCDEMSFFCGVDRRPPTSVCMCYYRRTAKPGSRRGRKSDLPKTDTTKYTPYAPQSRFFRSFSRYYYYNITSSPDVV